MNSDGFMAGGDRPDPVTARAFQYPQDFARLARFLGHMRAAAPHSHCLHPGDLTWQMFHMLADHPPGDLIHIWEDSQQEILGFVLLFPPYGGFEIQLRADQREGPLEAELLRWAEQHLPNMVGRSTLVNNRDTRRIKLLTDEGYAPRGAWLYLEQSLPARQSPPRIPAGFQLRSMAGVHEAGARAELLAAAFEAPPQPERYQRLMTAPGYVPALDVVAVGPDQRLAAFALGWDDPTSQVGQFEPVGTAPEFRRLGLGQAVLHEGLRRLYAQGAERAFVIVEEADAAACALYRSVGFELGWPLTWYARRHNP